MVVALQDRQRARSGVNVSTVPPRPRTRRDRAADQTRKIPAQPGRGQANSPAVNARRAASTSTTVITRPPRLHPPEHAVPTDGQATGELGLHDPRPIGGRQPLRPNGSRRPTASRCTPIPGRRPRRFPEEPGWCAPRRRTQPAPPTPRTRLHHDAVGPAQTAREDTTITAASLAPTPSVWGLWGGRARRGGSARFGRGSAASFVRSTGPSSAGRLTGPAHCLYTGPRIACASWRTGPSRPGVRRPEHITSVDPTPPAAPVLPAQSDLRTPPPRKQRRSRVAALWMMRATT